MRMALFICLVFVAVSTVACSQNGALSCPDETDRFVKYQLFHGSRQRRMDSEVVNDAAWDAFLEETVTPRFPDGHLASTPGASGATRKDRF